MKKHLKCTMLTDNVITRFESLVNLSQFTDNDCEEIEHLAYCSCIGVKNHNEEWERFTYQINRVFGIDLTELKNENFEILFSYISEYIEIDQLDDIDFRTLTNYINTLIVYCDYSIEEMKNKVFSFTDIMRKESPKQTIESRELKLFTVNNSVIYPMIKTTVKHLAKKYEKGVYATEKALKSYYRIAHEASKQYNHDFGYLFSVNDKKLCAIALEKYFIENVQENDL